MLDLTGVVDLLNTAIQGGFGMLVKAFHDGSGKKKDDLNTFEKANYDNILEIGRDISPEFEEFMKEWLYGKQYTKQNLRKRLTTILANIDYNESEIARKINDLRDSINNFSSHSSTVQRSNMKKLFDKAKELKDLEKEQKETTYRKNLARGLLDDASTAIYENKNAQNIAQQIDEAEQIYKGEKKENVQEEENK